MALKLLSLAPSPHSSPLRNPNLTAPSISNRRFPLRFFPPSSLPRRNSRSAFCRIDFVTPRAFQSQELTEFAEEEEEEEEEEERTATQSEKKDLAKQGIWSQIKEIVMFTGPATGLWICGPLMSLIDTAVIGQRSSIELAALGPATVVCDYMSYAFMFLSIATSNMVATALAKQDREEVQHHISVLLLIGLTCGFGMLLFSKLFGAAIITAFTGPKNVHVVPAASAYVQIRGLAWPALLVGWVAQSASLGMKDSWGPLKALVAASILNLTGCLLLCTYLGYGILGAAWATMISQVVAAYMMIQTLNSPITSKVSSDNWSYTWIIFRDCWNFSSLVISLHIYTGSDGHPGGTTLLHPQARYSSFSFINVTLFNSLLLRRECCNFSNGEYVKSGLAELEKWIANANEEYAGTSWHELNYIRQAVGFLVIHQKRKKSLEEIRQDLCPVDTMLEC